MNIVIGNGSGRDLSVKLAIRKNVVIVLLKIKIIYCNLSQGEEKAMAITRGT